MAFQFFKTALLSVDNRSDNTILSIADLFERYRWCLVQTFRDASTSRGDEIGLCTAKLKKHLREDFGAWEKNINEFEDNLSFLSDYTRVVDTIFIHRKSVSIDKFCEAMQARKADSDALTSALQSINARPHPMVAFELELSAFPEKYKLIRDGLGDTIYNLERINYHAYRRVKVWKLERPSMIGSCIDTSTYESTAEKRFGDFWEAEVLEADQEADGKFRAICKIWSLVDGAWCQGTGFVVDNYTVITVAHLAVHPVHPSPDCRRDISHASEFHVHVGYRGYDHVDKEVQVGAFVAVPELYEPTDPENRTHDFAVIRLQKPFRTIDNYITCTTCPMVGVNSSIAVVGFPGDIPRHARGRYLHISQGLLNYCLRPPTSVLYRNLETHGGNSGSPLLLQNENGDFSAIAVHSGGQEGFSNWATPINRAGNRIDVFCEALERAAAERQLRAGDGRIVPVKA